MSRRALLGFLVIEMYYVYAIIHVPFCYIIFSVTSINSLKL